MSSSRLTTRSLAAAANAVANSSNSANSNNLMSSQPRISAEPNETVNYGFENNGNVVIITSASAAPASNVEIKDSDGSDSVTQPPAVLTAAAALGMNLSTSSAPAADDSNACDEDEGGGGGGDGTVSGGSSSGGSSNGSQTLLMTRGRALKQRLSESSQTSSRQHTGDSGSAAANTQSVNHVAAAINTATTKATPTHAQLESEEEEEEDIEDSKMIDASDFRMVDPGCSYTTLAAAAAANGRMTPPNPGHAHHPHHHALHHSHAMTSYVNTSYTTLTPLQPLPPISTISSMQDKFQSYSPGGAGGPGETGATPTHVSEAPPVSVSNFVMQTNLSPYMSMSPPHYAGSHAAAAAAIAMGAHSPPQGEGAGPHHYPHNGGSGLHSKQEPLSPNSYYAEAQRPSPHHDMSPHSLDHSPTGGSNGGGNGPAMVPTSTYDALTSNNNPSLNGGMTSPHTISPVPHTSPLLHHREMSPPSPPSAHHGNNGASILAAAAASALGHQNAHHGHGMSMPSTTPTMVTLKSTPSSNNNNTSSGGGETEEINTKELAQRISAELKRYSIPQAIFAQRVLCRSQGTLSDLLRNPKPWSKLKSGRETFRRMAKWLQEPEFQRMSALRLAGKKLLREVFLKKKKVVNLSRKRISLCLCKSAHHLHFFQGDM